MTPRQVITMVMCWALAPAIIAAAIALPAGAPLEPVVAGPSSAPRPAQREHDRPHARGARRSRGKHPRGAPATWHRTRRNRAVYPSRPSRDQCPSPHQQRRGDQPPGQRAQGPQGIFAGAFAIAGRNPYTPAGWPCSPWPGWGSPSPARSGPPSGPLPRGPPPRCAPSDPRGRRRQPGHRFRDGAVTRDPLHLTATNESGKDGQPWMR
jgi:hypothetical protein